MPAFNAGKRRRRCIAIRLVALAGVMSLLGCASTIAGLPSRDVMAVPAAQPINYTPSNFDIEFAKPDGADQIARDALEDINAYWTQFYPQVYGKEFEPLNGRYYSIGPGEANASKCMDGPNDEVIIDNAFYCSYADEVAYWRPLLERFAGEYSDLQVGLVLAHEMGHAIQARDKPPSDRSIVRETQADCFAGSWARQVSDGNAAHFTFNEDNLDLTLQAWAYELPDQVGTDPDRRGAHGSAFDRVSAFQEGYESGPTACRDNFTDQRIFTSAVFTETVDGITNAGDDGLGNFEYGKSLELGQLAYNEFYQAKFDELGAAWEAPPLVVGQGDTPACADDHAVYYCPASNSVVISDDARLRDLHLKFGDYAVITTLGLAYGQAALLQLKYSMQDVRAIGAISCLIGTFSGEILQTSGSYDLSLKPGDFDEATVLLLAAKSGNTLVETGQITAFERMDQFRFGVTAAAGGSISSCGLNAPS